MAFGVHALEGGLRGLYRDCSSGLGSQKSLLGFEGDFALFTGLQDLEGFIGLNRV